MAPHLSRRASTATTSAIRDLLRLLERPDILSLAGGLPAPETFPIARMREAAERVLGDTGTYGSAALQYGPTEGVAGLREWVAAWLAACTPEEVVITTGSQQALDLLFHALVDPGDVVVVESPSYIGALQAVEATQPRLESIPMDADGMRVDLLAERLAAGLRPKCLYTVPNFQNPSGVTLSGERRRLLAALADEYDFVVIEDDPYGLLRFRGEHLAPLRTLTPNAVTLGTVSKLLAPGLRVGWAAAPTWLVGSLVRLKQARDLHTSSLSQHLALDVLSDRRFLSAHLAGLPAVYHQRCDALQAALAAGFGDRAEITRPDGGMFLWAQFAGIDTTAWLGRAIERGVAFVPGAAFHRDGGGAEAARFSFATLMPERLVEAAERLVASV
jgi:2-aminoadipate transaminase